MKLLSLALACCWLQLASDPSFAAAPAPRPNVIVIVADDLGWHDLESQGASDLKTPHIDSIATNGVRFKSGYVTAPVCSPSRAALMTGRYQQRFGHETNPGTELELSPFFGLPLTESTLGNRMRDLGYATGWIGKSHLGGVTNLYHPLLRGFDEFFGFLESHHDYTNAPGSYTNQVDPILRGLIPVDETNYLTTAFARECVSFIDAHTNGPFLLYAPFNATHFPLQATPDLFGRFSTNDFPGNLSRYTNAAMLAGLDDAVGEILGRLKVLGLESNTLVFFTSDNGGATNFGSINRPLRGEKTDVYEGGIRVPFLMQWPGRLPAGLEFLDPVSTLDILPTAVAAGGGALPAAWQLDGVNLLPYVLGQQAGVPHTNLFWRVETDGIPGDDVKEGVRAVRQGNWKLVKQTIYQTWELYDLATDIGETNNLALVRPDIVQRLVAAYDEWSGQMSRGRWARDNLTYQTPEFVVDDVRIGTNGISYLAPAFLAGEGIAFQDGASNLWRGEIDSRTGFLRSGHGLDQAVDTGLTAPDGVVGGASWGRSAGGAGLYYTKQGVGGGRQLWRTRISPSLLSPLQLTTNVGIESFGVRASQEPGSGSVKLVFNAGGSLGTSTVWADETTPWTRVVLPDPAPGFSNGRWIPGSDDLAVSVRRPGDLESQIGRYFTAGGTNLVLSDDLGDKTEVWPFFAPEYGGELCYAAVVDRTAVAIYRDLRDKANGVFTRVATLQFPSNAPARFIYSMQPLAGLRGFNGVSYFSCAAYEHDNPQSPGDTGIWIIGLGPDTNHPPARRVDDGMPLNATRREPRTFIGEREVFCYYSLYAGTNVVQLHRARTGIRLPDFAGPDSGFTQLRPGWKFTSGLTNASGVVVGGTETMALVQHQGRLFAATGNRMNQPYPETENDLRPGWTGAQILIKDSPGTPWRLDPAMPDIFRVHLRAEALVSFTFTTRSDGTRPLNPVNLLIAGLSDITTNGADQASARTRRDDGTGWDHSHVATTVVPANTISFGSHVDRSNGVHQIFAGLQNGEIYRGGYSPGAPGKIAWASNSVELTNVGPVTAFAEANGLLYAVCGLRQADASAAINGGVFLRRDTNVAWQQVYQWPHPAQLQDAPEELRLARGLSAVPDPLGESYEVLLLARAWPGVIERIDPLQRHAVTVELDVRDFLARVWQEDRLRSAAVTIGYTGFTAATNPVTGERVWLVGIRADHPDLSGPPWNGALFLIRHRDGTYEPADLGGLAPPVPAGQSLGATRCVAVSPFPEDGGAAFYFGGYDTAERPSTNTAWILRADWFDWPQLVISRPEPGSLQLSWPITDTNWLLETSAALGAPANWQPVAGLSTRSLTRQARSVADPGSNTFFRLHKP